MLKKIVKIKKEKVNNTKDDMTQRDSSVIEMCRKCYAFKYEDGWHFEKPSSLLENDLDKKITVSFSQCPPCIEEALAIYDMEYV